MEPSNQAEEMEVMQPMVSREQEEPLVRQRMAPVLFRRQRLEKPERMHRPAPMNLDTEEPEEPQKVMESEQPVLVAALVD